jgi:hypothetical protein
MPDNRGASIVLGYGGGAHSPHRVKTIPRRKPAKVDNIQELESDNVPRKSMLAGHTSRQSIANLRPGRVMNKAIDERGRYLLQSYGNKPRTKTIPVKKPIIDNFEETESQNQPRKKILAARTDGRGNAKNRPGNAANLGITKYSEGDVLRMLYKRVAQEAKLQEAMKRLKTMSSYYHDEVYAEAESLLESGDFDACEKLLVA